MSYILCIETGTDICSVGLARGGELVALRESADERDHARRVAVYTNEILEGHDIDPAALSAIAVSKGPGSYTGLRIGVSFAKGLCYGLNIPLIGVGSLDSLCEAAREDHEAGLIKAVDWDSALLVPMIDARRMEVFGQAFNTQGVAITEAGAWIFDDQGVEGSQNVGGTSWEDRFAGIYGKHEILIFGSGAEKCRGVLPGTRFVEVTPSARGMVRLASEAFENEKFEDTAYFEPFYLKDFVITTSKKKLL